MQPSVSSTQETRTASNPHCAGRRGWPSAPRRVVHRVVRWMGAGGQQPGEGSTRHQHRLLAFSMNDQVLRSATECTRQRSSSAAVPQRCRSVMQRGAAWWRSSVEYSPGSRNCRKQVAGKVKSRVLQEEFLPSRDPHWIFQNFSISREPRPTPISAPTCPSPCPRLHSEIAHLPCRECVECGALCAWDYTDTRDDGHLKGPGVPVPRRHPGRRRGDDGGPRTRWGESDGGRVRAAQGSAQG